MIDAPPTYWSVNARLALMQPCSAYHPKLDNKTAPKKTISHGGEEGASLAPPAPSYWASIMSSHPSVMPHIWAKNPTQLRPAAALVSPQLVSSYNTYSLQDLRAGRGCRYMRASLILTNSRGRR